MRKRVIVLGGGYQRSPWFSTSSTLLRFLSSNNLVEFFLLCISEQGKLADWLLLRHYSSCDQGPLNCKPRSALKDCNASKYQKALVSQ